MVNGLLIKEIQQTRQQIIQLNYYWPGQDENLIYSLLQIYIQTKMITKYFICLPMLLILSKHGVARLIISQRQGFIFTPQSFQKYGYLNHQTQIGIPQIYENRKVIEKFFDKNEVSQSDNQPYDSFINIPENFGDKKSFPSYQNRSKSIIQANIQSRYPPAAYNPNAQQENNKRPKFLVSLFLLVILPILGILILFFIWVAYLYCKRTKKQASHKKNKSRAKTTIKKSPTDHLIQTQRNLNPLTKEICCICLNYNCNATLPCNHYFHQECIKMWLEKIEYCPLCRNQISKTITFD